VVASTPPGPQPLVSVITPVYNGAPYIAQCIESVLAQTYPRFEYIVMDNCSTDGTAEIVRRYAAQDDRIALHTPGEFLDADPNANRAARQISTDSAYVKFVHADDWLFRECLERMVGLAVRHPSAGVVSAYRLEETRVTLDGLPPELELVPGRDAARSALLGRPWGYLFGSPTATLLRADLVRSRETLYPEDNPLQSDWEVCYQLLAESDFGFVHQVLTFTRRHNEALSTQFWRAGAELPGQIRLLQKYGPGYLSRSEYERRLAVLLYEYAWFLTRNAAQLRKREFRRLQADELRRIHARIAADEIARGVAHQVVRLARRARGA
jgi:glycosyltransferase involved in cell wall biosynthesis